MQVFSQLENAQLENIAGDSSNTATGIIWWDTTAGKSKIYDGTLTRPLLRNDQKCVFGNSVTSSENIRFHRGAAGVLQFLSGADTTAEGSLSTSLNQISARLENYTTVGLPAFGNAGRLVHDTTSGTMKFDDGTAWVTLSSLPALTDGSVTFASGGSLAQDNANFFWDDTNNRLGIGTATPSTALHVAKNSDTVIPTLTIEDLAVSLIDQEVFGSLEFSNNDGSGGGTGVTAAIKAVSWGVGIAGELAFYAGTVSGTSADRTTFAERMRITGAGKIGIGTTDPGYLLDIQSPINSSYLNIETSASGAEAILTSRAVRVTTGIAAEWQIFNSGTKIAAITSDLNNSSSSQGNLNFQTRDASAFVTRMTILSTGGIVVGVPTGGDKGAGTINAEGVYDDNILLTDYVFEKYFDGKVLDESKKDYEMKALDAEIEFVKQHKHLSTIMGRKEWETSGKPAVGKIISQLWETSEVQFLYIKELKREIERLKEERDASKK